MKKYNAVLAIVALFIVATMPGDELRSPAFIIKSAAFLIIAAIVLISLYRSKKTKKQ